MNTQPPEQNPNDYDEVTRLRLQLHHAETQRDAFAAGLKTDVLKIAKVAIYQASIDAGKSADADAMGCMAVELDDVKAENARLKDDLQMEKENEDRLVRNWQQANNEVHGLKSQVAALIDNQTRLKSEVERLRFAEDFLKDENKHLREEEPLPDGWNSSVAKACDLIAEKDKEIARLKADVARLKNNCDYLDRKLDEEIARAASFAGEIANLRKLGTAMGKYLPDTDEANRAYIDFEAGGRS